MRRVDTFLSSRVILRVANSLNTILRSSISLVFILSSSFKPITARFVTLLQSNALYSIFLFLQQSESFYRLATANLVCLSLVLVSSFYPRLHLYAYRRSPRQSGLTAYIILLGFYPSFACWLLYLHATERFNFTIPFLLYLASSPCSAALHL